MKRFKKESHSFRKKTNVIVTRRVTKTWCEKSLWWFGPNIWQSLPEKGAAIMTKKMLKHWKTSYHDNNFA